jgi:endonuclease/exonuclease/phosphatase family metal-dependent hydrolase
MNVQTQYPSETERPSWRHHLALMALCSTAFSCAPAKNYLDPEGPKFAGQYSGAPRVFDDTLKVVSFNIKFANRIGLATDELFNFSELRQADIILLQEMDEAGTDTIARALACNYVYYPATLHPQSDKNFGNAILAKWPMREKSKILLPHAEMFSGTRRIAVAAVVAVGDFEILTYSVHTATFVQGEEKRFQQAQAILESVPPQYQHVIIGGDFNTLSRTSLYAHDILFRQNHFILASSYMEPTARRWLFETTLDHIFVKGMRVLAAGTARASRASDHLPIWVQLVIAK